MPRKSTGTLTSSILDIMRTSTYFISLCKAYYVTIYERCEPVQAENYIGVAVLSYNMRKAFFHSATNYPSLRLRHRASMAHRAYIRSYMSYQAEVDAWSRHQSCGCYDTQINARLPCKLVPPETGTNHFRLVRDGHARLHDRP